jgi:MFS-type transporter involved in bile tolerance (Atg22 family)
VMNSAGVALLQVAASRGADRLPTASRRAVASGFCLAGACLLLAATDNGSGLAFILLVLLAGLLHLLGELLFIAASWGLTLRLTPPDKTGEYQGMAAAAQTGVQMMSPALMALLISNGGQGGWLVLAGLFLGAGTVTVPLTRLAGRRFEPGPEVQLPVVTRG